MIKIILTEDHNVVRNGIRSLLERSGEFEIVGEATNGQEALDLLSSGITPQLILSDMNMPGIGGMDLTERVSAQYPKIKVVLLSMLDNEKFVVKAFKCGAAGYLLKNISPDELIFSLKHVLTDNRYICSELAIRFLDRLIHLPDTPESDINPDNISFTDRELEVLEFIAQGLTNHEIADKLFTSKRTVEGYRKSMLEKTEMPNTAALIRYVMRNGIIS